jgi:hypothetical protein
MPIIARYILIGFVLVSGAFYTSSWLQGGWNLAISEASPDGQYRLDIYDGNRWQRTAYLYWFQDPGFAKITRRGDSRPLGTSPVFDLVGASFVWSSDGVLISTKAEFLYSQKRWIEPGTVRHTAKWYKRGQGGQL